MANGDSSDLSPNHPSLSEVKDMILGHVARLKNTPGVDLSNEYIGVKLNAAEIKTYFDQYQATDLVAFFGVDNTDANPSSTIILMGLDANGNVLKSSNTFPASERWKKIFLTADNVVNNASLDSVFQ